MQTRSADEQLPFGLCRFAEKESHQIFLEPEGRSTPELYVQASRFERLMRSEFGVVKR